jgi:excinuclease ABC subunit A
MTSEIPARAAPRTTIAVRGARVHNLKNISLEIPRDSLVVVTGLSGSGKSSLAFDTIYAEGQRRYMESLSSYAKRFVAQVAKPDVDFVFGLSPVISIEQKTVGANPRSTVGTMTDIGSYLNLLFATIAEPHCPRTGEPVPGRSSSQILEGILSLPEGTEIELRAPAFRVYGEELDFVFTALRKKGCRRLIVDGKQVDISEEVALDESRVRNMDAVVDRFVVSPKHEKAIKAGIASALLVGDGLMQVQVTKGAGKAETERFYGGLCSRTHHLIYGDIGPSYFVFNLPESACVTCGGLGVDKLTHPELLVPDPQRSIRNGCFVHEAFRYNPDNWDGQMMYSLGVAMGFSLDTPWEKLPEAARNAILYGTDQEKITIVLPPEAKEKRDDREGKEVGFGGIARRVERGYRWYRQRGEANSRMEEWLDKVMVERTCPDCNGSRLRATRLTFTIAGKNIYDVGQLNFDELLAFLRAVKPTGRSADAGRHVLNEIRKRVELLTGIGLDYLNFNRRSGTLSGGESQRIRLSTQIGSGLMGMLYVLDEPSIGLHPKDNVKMIATLESLRDIGNTVIVVEHDEATIRAADHIVEMGPGPGIHGGHVVVQGKLRDVLASKESPTGQFLSGRRTIGRPSDRRKGNGAVLTIRGASENNLKSVDVTFPLGMLVAVTGASGSGKSTLVNGILYKALWKKLVDTRTLPGKHHSVEGMDNVHRVVNIDQTPIGRNSRSNPATYIGFYDAIRDLFAEAPLSVERDYKAGRFSFNVKGGRCEECQGEGVITTQLYFMPDVEVTCGACKGARFNSETLEVTLQGKTIDDILNMPVEEGMTFFASEPAIGKKIEVLNDLGLGYLTLGQSATTLSGGEAQRVKIAAELSKLQRGKHTLYILDEPTTGLHLADVERLLDSLNRLVDAGHTVLLIEHHLDVIKTADHVIDLGPAGGHAGGEIVVTGSPQDIATCPRSHTGRFLKEVLRKTPVVERPVRRTEELQEAPRPVSRKKKVVPPRKEPVKLVAPKPVANRLTATAPSFPPQRFKAVVTVSGTRTIITVPFDPNKVWGTRARHYASGTIGGHHYRGLLEPAGIGFFLALGPAWRRDKQLDIRKEIEVVLYPDGLQISDLPPDVIQALELEPDARSRFESLTTGNRKYIMRWIESAKRAETRAARIKQMVGFLKSPPKQRVEQM